MSIFDDLAAPIDPARVSWRVGATTADKSKGMALAYIDARDVLERLDAVLTPARWQCEYVPMSDGSTCCRLGVKIDNEWIWKANGGMNVADSDKSDAREMAAKGGYSDAFKRAAVQWGIGRYLYDIDSPWVELEQKGKTHVITASALSRLQRLLEGKAAKPAPAPPNVPKAITPAPDRPLKGAIVLRAELLALKDAAAVGDWWAKHANDLGALTDIQYDDLRTEAQDRKRELANPNVLRAG